MSVFKFSHVYFYFACQIELILFLFTNNKNGKDNIPDKQCWFLTHIFMQQIHIYSLYILI